MNNPNASIEEKLKMSICICSPRVNCNNFELKKINRSRHIEDVSLRNEKYGFIHPEYFEIKY